MGIIRRILEKWVCRHEWEILQKVSFYQESNSELPHRIAYLLSCKKCGKLKQVEIKS